MARYQYEPFPYVTPPELAGGLRGRSAAEIHAQIVWGIEEAHRTATTFASMKEDVQKAFPSVWLDVAMHIMERLGLPEHFRHLLRAFSSTLTRTAAAARSVGGLRGRRAYSYVPPRPPRRPPAGTRAARRPSR